MDEGLSNIEMVDISKEASNEKELTMKVYV